MDTTYVATAMTGEAEMPEAVVMTVQRVLHEVAIVAYSQVAADLRPLSIGGTSLSAVSPDNSYRKELALAGV
jgi:hypothetical protein